MNHIRDKLPDMKARLNTLMGQTQQELAAFGDTAFLGEQHRGSLILKLMTQFARDFVASIDGTSFDISTKELCGGARVYYIFHDVFGHALESINPTTNLTVQDIRTAIRNSTGPRPSLFVPEQAFELLIKPQIKLLEPPSLRCVELVYEELMKICHNCTSQELQRFPRLHAQLIEVVSELLRERLGPTSEYVQSLIAIQAAYINTNHPAFVQDSANIARQTREGQNQKQNMIAQRSEYQDGDSQSGAITEEDEEQMTSKPTPVNGSAKSARRNEAAHTKYGSQGRGMAASVPNLGAVGSRADAQGDASGKGETFLNYFFGSASGMPGPSALGTTTSGFAPAGQSQYGGRPNPMAGRMGLEGSSAAYDMKSLDKHLEAVSLV